MNDTINIKRINETLDRYPNLKNMFGEIGKISTIYNYQYKQDKNIDYEWNFFGILNSEDYSNELIEEIKDKKIKLTESIPELISFNLTLNNISFKKRILGKVNFLVQKLSNAYSSDQLKEGLTNNPFSFLSELEFANFCLESKYKIIEVDPVLNSGKKLDLKIEMNSKPVLVEVVTPRLKLNMLQKQVGFFPISAEIENNIKAEFEHHQIEINDIKEDFIIVINGDYAGLDSINIQSAIMEFSKKHEIQSRYISGIFLKRWDKFVYFKNEQNINGTYQQ